MSETNPGDNRQITIRQDAIGSTMISGDANQVYIYHYQLDTQVETKPSTPNLGANPYRGLEAFQEKDANVYFGREGEIERLWNRLREFQERSVQTDPPIRLLPILGASGSGKSSLARAGLLPELARRPLPGYRQPRVVVMTPGDSPLQSLAVVLARIATGDSAPVEKAAEFERVLNRPNDQNQMDGLRRIAHALPNIDHSPLVILIDQFEETYSLCKDREIRDRFVDTLVDAAATPGARVSMVMTLRSDFLSETQKHPQLDQIIGSDQCVVVTAMAAEELHRAIAEPAKQARHPLDEVIIDRLIEQTERREGALPLLQFALTQIWEGLEQGKSATETLKAIGGVGGALAGEAQRIYDDLKDNEKDIARRVFVGLVELGEGTRDTRRRATVESLTSAQDNPTSVREVIGRFSAPGVRLLTLSWVEGKEASVAGKAVAEVTHEALLDHWQQIREWLDGQRHLIRQQRRINTLAEEWKGHSKKSGYLLQGRQLDDAHKFHKQHVESFPLSENAAEFVRKSLRQRWLWRAAVASFLIVPALVIDGFLREAAVREHYTTLEGEDVSGKPEAAQALVKGCRRLFSLPDWFDPVGERIFGTCRTLEDRNLAEIDLSNADLRATELIEANLSNADLRATELIEANLSRANLSNADLNDAILAAAELIEADLSNANLNDALLFSADLSFADLSNANLSNALLFSADLTGTDLSNANLSNADLSNAGLSSTDLSNANLSNADLSNAELYANLSNADLSNADLSNADLGEAILLATDLSDSTGLEQAQLTNSENSPLLCNVKLPAKLKHLANRDCDRLSQVLLERYPDSFENLEDAKMYVEEARRE